MEKMSVCLKIKFKFQLKCSVYMYIKWLHALTHTHIFSLVSSDNGRTEIIRLINKTRAALKQNLYNSAEAAAAADVYGPSMEWCIVLTLFSLVALSRFGPGRSSTL